MEILAQESDWTPNDEQNWSAFLETATGKRLIPKLTENMPELLSGGEINAVLIRSGEVRAFQKAIETLILLAHPPAPAPGSSGSSEYPPLEKDDAWNDGQKLTPPASTPEQEP